jgi:hypothetical protein
MKDESRRKRIIVWWTKGDPLRTWLAFFILIIYVVWLFGFKLPLDARLRLIGMLFQFVGLIGVIVGLSEARKLFKRPSFFLDSQGMAFGGGRDFSKANS